MVEKKLALTHTSDTELIFESFGVKVKLQANSVELLRECELTARKALLDRLRILEIGDAEHTFRISEDPAGLLSIDWNGDDVGSDSIRPRFFKFFNSLLRIAVAEYAKDFVFIHAGVVGWKGRAIVIPANSFAGKSTLVSELVKNGAEYYSDEYALLDEDGLVHPFPRDLSIRDQVGGTVVEREVTVASLGGKVGTMPIPVGLVLLTEFDPEAAWKPEKLTTGNGIMEMIPHTIPRRFNTGFSLKVLNTAVSDAIILKSHRGDATEFAIKLLSFFDNISNLAKIT